MIRRVRNFRMARSRKRKKKKIEGRTMTAVSTSSPKISYILYGKSIFVLVEEEILLGRIVGPYVLDGFVYFALILQFLKVFYHLHGSAGTHGVVDEFVLCCGPGSIFEFRCKFKSPIHGYSDLFMNYRYRQATYIKLDLRHLRRKITHFRNKIPNFTSENWWRQPKKCQK